MRRRSRSLANTSIMRTGLATVLYECPGCVYEHNVESSRPAKIDVGSEVVRRAMNACDIALIYDLSMDTTY